MRRGSTLWERSLSPPLRGTKDGRRRLAGRVGLERDLPRSSGSNPPAVSRDIFNPIGLLRAPSSLTRNVPGDPRLSWVPSSSGRCVIHFATQQQPLLLPRSTCSPGMWDFSRRSHLSPFCKSPHLSIPAFALALANTT